MSDVAVEGLADAFGQWRDAARAMLRAGRAPEGVHWGAPSLFEHVEAEAAVPVEDVRVPAAFLPLAKSVFLHRGEGVQDLLYRLLWRLQGAPQLLGDATDADVLKAAACAKAVRRDIHKMRAFVRFREVETAGEPHFVAWFEPDHRIVAANAGFFVRRFASMDWTILTPDLCLTWDGERCRATPGIAKPADMADDPAEALWRSYYASTFNPSRLKTGAMLKEMPRRYWKNMPETALIPGLIAGAQARMSSMVARGAAPDEAAPADWGALASGVDGCTRCPLHCNATQAVHGEGPRDAGLMVVGEQPGDQEDLRGRPFVGPAGQVLDGVLVEAGIDRQASYLTNAVKHFKHELRGKVRLHKTPTAREIDHCRWWLDAEVGMVKPRTIVALGASAARGLLGRTVNVTQARAAPMLLGEGTRLIVTVHPSYILRLPMEAQGPARAAMVDDLARAAAL